MKKILAACLFALTGMAYAVDSHNGQQYHIVTPLTIDDITLASAEVTTDFTSSGVTYLGAANSVSTFPALGSPTIKGTLTAGVLTSLSGVNGTIGTFSNTSAGSLDIGGGLNAGTGNVALIDATGKITALSSTYLANLSGANLTTLTAANISDGSLGGSVIASSVAVAAVQDNSIVGMTSSKLSGALPAISGASLTTLTAANLTGALPAIDGALLTNVGTLVPEIKTVTQIAALTGVVGKVVICSNCTGAYGVCVGTSTTSGAGAAAYVLSGDGLTCH